MLQRYWGVVFSSAEHVAAPVTAPAPSRSKVRGAVYLLVHVLVTYVCCTN